jgi:diacylglycerol kinase
MTDFKVAIYQLLEHFKLLNTNAEQWARLADAAHEHELSGKLKDAGAKAAEAGALLETAMEDLRHHNHGHVHITEV